MAKIEVEVTIKNREVNECLRAQAIVQENSIKYLEKDDTKVVFDYNKNKLIRENTTMKMTYYFDNKTESDILVKDYNRHLKFMIKTNKLKKKDYNLEVDYQIDNDKFLYRIEEIKWV